MLKFQKNVHDTLQSVKVAMGTNPDPAWMLIFNIQDNSYSAIDYDVPQDIIDYSIKNNLINICWIDPHQLIEVLEHPEPHEFCQSIHEFVTMHRPDPDQIPLRAFLPVNPFSHTQPPVVDDPVSPAGFKSDNGDSQRNNGSTNSENSVIDNLEDN